ncbi:hypothetical protein EU523_00245 [Candidatus Heimdallarchaeota archaeon]|nr:MAG: hypothetical protein EU523_00245 [Candidatus Heimdallarchaeota archaeon]
MAMLWVLAWVTKNWAPGPYSTPYISKDELKNHQVSHNQTRNDFFQLLDKCVVKGDEKYTELIHKKENLKKIILWYSILSTVAIIPLVLLKDPIINLVESLTDTTITNRINAILIAKMVIDVVIIIWLMVFPGDRIIKKMKERRETLFEEYMNFLKNEIEVKKVEDKYKVKSGKWMVFYQEVRSDPGDLRKTDLSQNEEISVFHELGKLLLYHNYNSRSVILFGLMPVAPIFLLYMFFDPNIVPVFPFLMVPVYLFLLATFFQLEREEEVRLSKRVVAASFFQSAEFYHELGRLKKAKKELKIAQGLYPQQDLLRKTLQDYKEESKNKEDKDEKDKLKSSDKN